MDNRDDGIFAPLLAFLGLINPREIDARQKLVGQRLYTHATIIAIMLYRRIAGEISQASVINALMTMMPQHFRESKRGREGAISNSPAAFSKARKQMPLSIFHEVIDSAAQKLLEKVRPTWNGLHVFLLDGTTMNAAPEPTIRDVFPGATNQKGTSAYPVINVAVATGLSTGLVIRPELGAMYGPNAVSETQLGMKVISRLPENSLIIADAGFGIFRTAWHILTTGRYFLLRISPGLFGSLVKRMEKEGRTFTGCRARITWPVTSKNLKSSPWLPKNGAIEIYLHRIQVGEKWIYLIENFGMTTKTAGDFYVQRVNVETDIENIKVRLRGEKLNGKCADVVQKELAIIILHYQLLAAARMKAAKLRNLPPRKLSFTETRECVRNYFERSAGSTKRTVRAHFVTAIKLASKCRIPERPGRSFKRECYHKRPRCDNFPRRPVRQAENLTRGKAKPS